MPIGLLLKPYLAVVTHKFLFNGMEAKRQIALTKMQVLLVIILVVLGT